MPRKTTWSHQIVCIGDTTRAWLGAKPAEIYLLRCLAANRRGPPKRVQRPATHAQATAWARRHGVALPAHPPTPAP